MSRWPLRPAHIRYWTFEPIFDRVAEILRDKGLVVTVQHRVFNGSRMTIDDGEGIACTMTAFEGCGNFIVSGMGIRKLYKMDADNVAERLLNYLGVV